MERPNFSVNSTFFVTYNSVDANFDYPRFFDSVEQFGISKLVTRNPKTLMRLSRLIPMS